ERRVGAAGAARGEAPGDTDQVAEDALDQEALAAPGDPLEAEDRPLAGQRQVLRAVARVADPPADHPDRVAAPDLRHDDPTGQELAQRSGAVVRLGPPQQAELLGGPQLRAAAEEALQRVPVGVAEPAGADRPVRDAAP